MQKTKSATAAQRKYWSSQGKVFDKGVRDNYPQNVPVVGGECETGDNLARNCHGFTCEGLRLLVDENGKPVKTPYGVNNDWIKLILEDNGYVGGHREQ